MEAPETSPAVRVEIEYEDGRVTQLTGESAQQFVEQVHGAAVMAFVHGARPPQLPWVVVRPRRGE